MEHYQPLVRRFFWVLLGAIVLVVGVGLMVLMAIGRPPPALLVFVPVIIASLDAGREYARRTDASARGKAAWALTASFFLINAALSGFILLGGLWSAGSLDLLAPSELWRFAAPMMIFLALYVATIRMALWVGGSLR